MTQSELFSVNYLILYLHLCVCVCVCVCLCVCVCVNAIVALGLLQALVEIGDHIATCLLEYRSEEKIAEWRTYVYSTNACEQDITLPSSHCSNLWVFVSKFTSVSAQKLHKMYKKAKRETEKHQASNHPALSPSRSMVGELQSVYCIHLPQQPSMMPVKKRYLDMATHASQHNDSKSHR